MRRDVAQGAFAPGARVLLPSGNTVVLLEYAHGGWWLCRYVHMASGAPPPNARADGVVLTRLFLLRWAVDVEVCDAA
jgi:hypothetical protein